jgi:uncharacterized protein YbbC (DUF1343 family)
MKTKKIRFGIDLFLQYKTKFQNTRFGLVTNNAAMTTEGELNRVALLKAGFKIIKLFSPEHGLTANGTDGTYQKNITDPVTKLPVISLYSEKLMPDKGDLTDIDIVLFDIPDVGCRFYTYLWTMTYVMESCAAHHKKFILLDRPNPISGNINLSEGPMIDEKGMTSFIGRWNIPIRHSCTLGELAKYFSATRIKNIDLEVIRLQNWEREQTGVWPFVSPSPAITDMETALLYPGLGLLEVINVNEGRGTETPFKFFGAPWINATEFQNEFFSLSVAGIKSQPVGYVPTSGLYANEICHGLKLSVSDAFLFRPVEPGLQLIHLLLSMYPQECTERLYKTTVNPSGEKHLDNLLGVKQSLIKLKKGEIPETKLDDSQWKMKILPYLIY